MALHDYNTIGETDKDRVREGVWDDDTQHGASKGDLQPTKSEISESVDDSYGLQSASTIRGFSVMPTYTVPDRLSSSASGGGSTVYGSKGADVNPGTTSGDTANLQSVASAHMDRHNHVRLRLTFNVKSGAPTGDVCRIGWPTATRYEGLYYDVKNSELVAGDGTNYSTKACGSVSAGWVEANIGSAGYTIDLYKSNGNLDTALNDGTGYNQGTGKVMYMQSNGNGNGVLCEHIDLFVSGEGL